MYLDNSIQVFVSGIALEAKVMCRQAQDMLLTGVLFLGMALFNFFMNTRLWCAFMLYLHCFFLPLDTAWAQPRFDPLPQQG